MKIECSLSLEDVLTIAAALYGASTKPNAPKRCSELQERFERFAVESDASCEELEAVAMKLKNEWGDEFPEIIE